MNTSDRKHQAMKFVAASSLMIGTLLVTGVILFIFLLTSCERRDIYEEGKTAVPVIVSMDWRNLGGDPEGASIYFYPEDGSTPYSFKTNSVGKAQVQVPTGYYTVIVFNRTVDEYGTMHFEKMNALGTAKAVLEFKTTWAGTADSVGRTVYEPEVIVCGRTDHFQVRERTSSYIQEHESTRATTDPLVPDTCYVTPQRMTYTATVKVRVNGIQNAKSVRSYVTNLAGGEYLATRSATDTLATFVIENWTISRDETDYTKGYLVGTFTCFGLPEQFKEKLISTNNRLLMKVLLQDEETIITKGYDVGDIILQNDKELTLNLNVGLKTREGDDPIDAPDVKPKEGTASGFDVTIEDWGDAEDVVVPL